MKKALVYLSTGLVAIVSLFFAFANLAFKFVTGVPAAQQTAITENAAEGGKLKVTFFEFLGDFANNDPAPTFVTYLSVILVVIGIICAATLLVSGIMMLIRKDYALADTLALKWISLASFATVLVALLLNLFIPNFPAVPTLLSTVVTGYTSAIGLGSIFFLAATAIGTVLAFVFKD